VAYQLAGACLEVWSPLSSCPRSSLPAAVLDWLAARLAHLLPPCPPGWHPPLSLEVRLDAVAAVILDGLSYRRAARMVGISKTEAGDSMNLLLGPLGDSASASPTGASSPAWMACASGLRRWPAAARRCAWTGWREVASLPDRGFRGLARAREHWYAPVGDRRTSDRLTQQQRAYNRLRAGLRALVEQSIAHLAGAWSLRRWRGLLYRVRDVFRAAGALICLGRWLHRIPT
jgi:hypothetical protein